MFPLPAPHPGSGLPLYVALAVILYLEAGQRAHVFAQQCMLARVSDKEKAEMYILGSSVLKSIPQTLSIIMSKKEKKQSPYISSL